MLLQYFGFMLLTLSVHISRHKAVTNPLHQHTSKKTTFWCVVTIWVCSILLALPMALFHEFKYIPDKTFGAKPFCTPYPSIKSVILFDPETYTLNQTRIRVFTPISDYLNYDHFMIILFVIQFVIPFVILAVFYSKISLVLWARTPPGVSDEARDQNLLKQKKRSVKMMMTVVVAFLVCWLPWHLFHCCQVFIPTFKK